MNYDNSAYRLLAILEAGKALKDNRNCRECWEELLGVTGNTALLMSRLSKVMALPQTIVTEIQSAYPSHGNTWAHWEGQVSAAFMVQNMHAEWKTFNSNIDAHTLTYLKLAAELLNSRSHTQLLKEQEVATVRKRVADLLDEALASDLPSALKAQVARCLRRLIESLDEYRLTGAVSVLEASEIALGHASLDSEYRSFLHDTELGKRTLDAISAAANLLTISQSLPALSVAITQLLK
jgi:hypothetical protein